MADRTVLETEAKRLESQKEQASEETFVVEDATARQLPRQRSRGWLVPLLLGTGLGIAIAVGGTRLLNRPPAQTSTAQPSQLQPASLTVALAPVERAPVARELNVTGTVAARNLISVLPEATGLQIEQILVEEGDVVEKGQVLAVLNSSVLQQQINQAQAELESAQAVVNQRQATLAQSRAELAEAQRGLERYQQLARAGAISQEALDTRVTAVATATEDIRVAEANISSAQASVRSNRARLQQLQTQLAQTQVRAPVSGLVAEQSVEVGDVTNATQQLFSIVQNQALELQAQVPAIELPQVRVGAPATITSDADSRVRLQGEVKEISPLVDAESRQATVEITIPPNNLLRPGMFARAAITTETVSGLTVPAKAVIYRSAGEAVVFVLSDNNTVQAKPVEVGETLNNGSRVEITQGLKPSDRVVVAGAGYLKDGDRVRVAGARE